MKIFNIWTIPKIGLGFIYKTSEVWYVWPWRRKPIIPAGTKVGNTTYLQQQGGHK